jgi:dihydrodipicolinate synthase/N-acetylneuraminate lyase
MPMRPITPLPKGIFPLLETPFDEKGEIDLESLSRLIEDTIAGGVAGLMAPLVASEVHALSLEERETIVRHVATAIAGRIPFVVGASSDRVDECRHFARLAEEVGASAYLVAVPQAAYGRPDWLREFFQSIAAASALPLIIQDLQWNAPGLDIPFIRSLKEQLPTLAGMKIETVPAGPKYSAVRSALGESFFIAGGWAILQLIEALDRGVDAMVPESALVRVFVAIYRAYAQGRRDAAIGIFRQLLPVLVFSNQELFQSIAFFKRLLARKGLLRTATMRGPGFEWDPFRARIADELIAYYLDLEPRVADWGL